MVAGEVSQLSLIGLEGSCGAKTRQLLSSWLRLWEPVRKAKMHFTTLQDYAWSLSLSYVFLAQSLLSFLFTKTQQNHTKLHKVSDFYLMLNYNLWFCSRPSSSIYSVMWFRIPTLQRSACGVGCMFRFLQMNFVWVPLCCDRLNQSNVNKHP